MQCVDPSVLVLAYTCPCTTFMQHGKNESSPSPCLSCATTSLACIRRDPLCVGIQGATDSNLAARRRPNGILSLPSAASLFHNSAATSTPRDNGGSGAGGNGSGLQVTTPKCSARRSNCTGETQSEDGSDNDNDAETLGRQAPSHGRRKAF
jgi:hypothetical protein